MRLLKILIFVIFSKNVFITTDSIIISFLCTLGFLPLCVIINKIMRINFPTKIVKTICNKFKLSNKSHKNRKIDR